jgi:hypothetical protein
VLAYLSFRRCCLSVHFFLWFEPLPGKEMEFRDELLRSLLDGEIGYLDVYVFEALREPYAFAIHSQWGE